LPFLLFLFLLSSCGILQKKPDSASSRSVGAAEYGNASRPGAKTNINQSNQDSTTEDAEAKPKSQSNAGSGSDTPSQSSIQGSDPAQMTTGQSTVEKPPSVAPKNPPGGANPTNPNQLPLADGVLVNENFESVAPGEIPKWATHFGSPLFGPILKVTDTKSFTGTKSLLIDGIGPGGEPNFLVYPLPAVTDHFFIKAHIMLSRQLGQPSTLRDFRVGYLPLIGLNPTSDYYGSSKVSPNIIFGEFGDGM
jgi:hypothetical protein